MKFWTRLAPTFCGWVKREPAPLGARLSSAIQCVSSSTSFNCVSGLSNVEDHTDAELHVIEEAGNRIKGAARIQWRLR